MYGCVNHTTSKSHSHTYRQTTMRRNDRQFTNTKDIRTQCSNRHLYKHISLYGKAEKSVEVLTDTTNLIQIPPIYKYQTHWDTMFKSPSPHINLNATAERSAEIPEIFWKASFQSEFNQRKQYVWETCFTCFHWIKLAFLQVICVVETERYLKRSGYTLLKQTIKFVDLYHFYIF